MDISFLLLFVIVCIHNKAHGEDWVFQKIEDFAGFTPNYYMYQAVTKDIMTECFQYCSVNKECSIVKITKTECYCSVYPIKDNFVMKINPDDHTKVYFKRPLGVCERSDYIYFKGMCFKVMKIEKTWQDAKTDCEFSGGQLISLDTEEKFNITVEFVDIFDTTSYFIGATDIGYEGHWRWLNNENRNYFKFGKSQPNNYDSDFPGTYPANCGSLGGRSKNAGIYDDYCDRKRQYICGSS